MQEEPLIYILPLLTGAALMLLAPAALMQAARARGAALLLTGLMLSFAASLLLIRLNSHVQAINASKLIAASLAMLGTGLAAAPLLDRARSGGLAIGASIGGIFLVPAVLHGFIPHLPPLGGVAALDALLIAATITGLGGSMQLAVHPGRYTAGGARRLAPTNAIASGIGWLALSGALLLLAALMLPSGVALGAETILTSGLAAAFLVLIRSRAGNALPQAAAGFTAGCTIALGGQLALDEAALAGLVAGCCVLRSEAITSALRLDDPQQLIGALLLPAMLGLLACGAGSIDQFGNAIEWLGAALGLGLVFALLLWPLTKLTLGLALPQDYRP